MYVKSLRFFPFLDFKAEPNDLDLAVNKSLRVRHMIHENP